MPRQLEFANLILTFGSDKVLIDLFDEVVLPAFTDPNLLRERADTKYFFNQVTLIDLGTEGAPVPAIVGKLVKDTLLTRDQVYNSQTLQLESDPRQMQSSPSAVFVLLVENHKLLYLHETAHAPDISVFRGTLKHFLRLKYFSFIEREYEVRSHSVEPALRAVTKLQLQEEFQPPDLSIIPLSSEASLEEFVSQYGLLRQVKVELGPINTEIHNDAFFVEMRQKKDAIGSKKSTLVHHNPGGLNKDATVTQLSLAAAEGNARISMDGKNLQGERLSGSNNDIRLRIPMANIPPELPSIADRMHRTFLGLVERGTLKLGQVDGRVRQETRRFINRFRRPDGQV
jgi:hypothetical protein